MRDLLMKSRFHLRGIYFFVDRPQKDRQKLAVAQIELKTRIAKVERGLVIQHLKVGKSNDPTRDTAPW